jgi:hypothetical protein
MKMNIKNLKSTEKEQSYLLNDCVDLIGEGIA